MTSQALFFEDVEVGSEVPCLVEQPTAVQLFMFSAVNWNRARIHFDADFARDVHGLSGIVVQGPLLGSFIARMIMGWMGEEGTLRKLSWTNRRASIPGDVLTCGGRVIDKYVKDGKNYLECEVWIENQAGERITPGKATVIVPSRS